jgi:hypothetical protein
MEILFDLSFHLHSEQYLHSLHTSAVLPRVFFAKVKQMFVRRIQVILLCPCAKFQARATILFHIRTRTIQVKFPASFFTWYPNDQVNQNGL